MHDPPRMPGEDHDAVRQLERLRDRVRDEQDRGPDAAPDPAQLGVEPLAGQRVQRAEGLVEQKHLRLHRQGARDRRALPHPAGELVRTEVVDIVQADQAKDLGGPAHPGVRLPAGELKGKGHVLQGAAPGHEPWFLEHEADAFAGPRERVAGDLDPAAVGDEQAADQAQEGALAGPVGSDDGHELAARHAEAHRGHCRPAAGCLRIGEGDVLQRHGGRVRRADRGRMACGRTGDRWSVRPRDSFQSLRGTSSAAHGRATDCVFFLPDSTVGSGHATATATLRIC